jgi:hypothetical protein
LKTDKNETWNVYTFPTTIACFTEIKRERKVEQIDTLYIESTYFLWLFNILYFFEKLNENKNWLKIFFFSISSFSLCFFSICLVWIWRFQIDDVFLRFQNISKTRESFFCFFSLPNFLLCKRQTNIFFTIFQDFHDFSLYHYFVVVQMKCNSWNFINLSVFTQKTCFITLFAAFCFNIILF